MSEGDISFDNPQCDLNQRILIVLGKNMVLLMVILWGLLIMTLHSVHVIVLVQLIINLNI